MEFYVYNDLIFKDYDSMAEWIAENELYLGEEGFMTLCESAYTIDNFEELLEFAEEQGYDIEELIKEFNLEMELKRL